MCIPSHTSFIYHLSLFLYIGGLVPVLGLTATSVWTKSIFAGLYFPLACISLCALSGFFFVPETKDAQLSGQDHAAPDANAKEIA